MNNFQTSKIIALLCQYVGAVAAIICGIALLGTLFSDTVEPLRRAQDISVYAGGTFGGLIMVIGGQLVEAQITVAINSTSILNLLQARETPASATTAHTPAPANAASAATLSQSPSHTSIPEGGKFLRMYKGAELHKHDDGISVNGEGRFSSILEAEKQAQKLAENQS